MTGHAIGEKTGFVVGVKAVTDDDDIMLMESGGIMIRMSASNVSVHGRATKGVRMMRLGEYAKVISLERFAKEPEAGVTKEELDAAPLIGLEKIIGKTENILE